MGEHSAIEWTDATWTPIRARFETLNGDEAGEPRIGWHCEHTSEGCRFCYAETMNRRLGTLLPFKPGHRKDVDLFLDEKMLFAPLRWKRPRRIFVCSMTDLFADFVKDEWIDRMFAVMALCPQHVFQMLTKRPKRMRAWFERYDAAHDHNCADMVADSLRSMLDREYQDVAAHRLHYWPLPNVWLGTSVEDQAAADARIPHLLPTPAAVRFLSCEPLLGPVDLSKIVLKEAPAGCSDQDAWAVEPLTGRIAPIIRIGPGEWELDGGGQRRGKIDWVIAGGESGKNARPSNPQWFRDLRDQCATADVPYFFKQWGEWVSVSEVEGPQTAFHVLDDHRTVRRVGKKKAGRLLDGVLHDGMPA